MPTPDELRAQAAFLLSQATELDKPLTKADVSRLFKAREYDAIVAARKDGRLNNLLTMNTDEGK